MANNVKNIILKKKIGEVLYDLMVKTNVDWINYDETTSLGTKLASMLEDISNAKASIAELVGEGEGGSIATMIETAINDLKTAMENLDDAQSVASRIKANKDAIAAINDSATGILALSKEYTDTKIGLGDTTYQTVKAYVDAVESNLNAKIAGAFYFKGVVNYVADLANVENPQSGFVYQVKYRGTEGTDPLNAEYAYDGTSWVELGSIIDLSAYSTTEQVMEAINAAKTAAAEDATSKANAAQAAAIEAAAADATSKANAAQAAAEATAAAALESAVNGINSVMATKARFLVGTSVPEDLTEADIFGLIVE